MKNGMNPTNRLALRNPSIGFFDGLAENFEYKNISKRGGQRREQSRN